MENINELAEILLEIQNNISLPNSEDITKAIKSLDGIIRAQNSIIAFDPVGPITAEYLRAYSIAATYIDNIDVKSP